MATEFPPEPIQIGSALQDFDAELEEHPEEQVPDEDLYWAERSNEAFVAVLQEREREWFEYALNHGYIDMCLVAMSEYYGIDPTTVSGFDAAQIDFEGDDGELVRFRVNEFRTYLRQHVSTTTKERPAFKAGTLNTGYSGGAQSELVDNLANYVYEHFMGEVRERRLVEREGLFAKMHVWVRWDEHGGELTEQPVMIPAGTELPGIGPIPEAMESGQVEQVRTGEPIARIKAPWDVIEDPTVDDQDDHAWKLVRERRSKWEIQSLFPEMKTEIQGASITNETAYELSMAFDGDISADDYVMVKHFYHPPCSELPEGMYALVLGEHVLERMPWSESPVASDTEMPIHEYAPAEMVNSSFAYGEYWDQIGIQQMLTQITSDMASNVSALGRQFLMLPEGSEITPEQLANGMFAAYVPEDQVGKVAAPNLAQIGSGAQWFAGWLQKEMQTLAGQNSVSRGDPAENIKSGTMAALFHAIALEHGHIASASLDRLREQTCMTLIDYMRRFAKGPILARIVGPDEVPNLRHFKADTFEPIKQVFIKTSNPMLRSRAGQMEIANYLKDIPGAITSPQQAIQLITTGQLKPLYRSPESCLQRVQYENEMLREGPQVEEKQVPRMDQMTGQQAIDEQTGQPAFNTERRVPQVPVSITDNPYVHINEALVVANDPTASKEAKAACSAHIAEHLRVYRTVPPELAAILGFPPVQAAQPQKEITGPAFDTGKAASNLSKAQQLEETGQPMPKPAEPPKGSAA